MPYIPQEDRHQLSVHPRKIETPGQLNYLITRSLVAYLRQHKLSYQTINDIMGALEGAKMEFYRRVVVKYEDKKISENGDVYPEEVT